MGGLNLQQYDKTNSLQTCIHASRSLNHIALNCFWACGKLYKEFRFVFIAFGIL